jgi:hypothetical protein
VAYPVFHPFTLATQSGFFCGFQHSLAIVGMNLLDR